MLIYDYGLILINNNRPVMYVHPIQKVTEEQDRHACSELLRSPWMVFCALTRHSTSYGFGSATSPIDFLRIFLEAFLREPETMNVITNYDLL